MFCLAGCTSQQHRSLLRGAFPAPCDLRFLSLAKCTALSLGVDISVKGTTQQCSPSCGEGKIYLKLCRIGEVSHSRFPITWVNGRLEEMKQLSLFQAPGWWMKWLYWGITREHRAAMAGCPCGEATAHVHAEILLLAAEISASFSQCSNFTAGEVAQQLQRMRLA